MSCEDHLIYINEIRTSHYEKNNDLVNVHVYVKQVCDCNILFEDQRVICKFSTKDSSFLKKHKCHGGKGGLVFCHVIETRHPIDTGDCKFAIKAPFIELILKKKTPQRWSGLRCKMPISPSQKQGKKLLGGKSTPLKSNEEKKRDESKAENSATAVASSSKSEDERNIKKAVANSNEPEILVGLTGLENYANNCYMNVVIQVLANIQEARDYFRNDNYLKDVNSNNPLSSGGKVAKAFSEVVQALWSSRKNPFKPSALKNIMGKRYSLFLGWQQHDAQEFFASLLDNLHEDLNQSSIEKGAEKETKPDGESTVNEKPDTAWAAHLKRNNSFIVRLFHGQLVSKLTCAACHKVSYSYDPCASISLPIPTTKNNMKVLHFSRDINKPPLLIPMQISTPNAKVWHLVNMLHPIVKVPSHVLAIFNGIQSVCSDMQAPLGSVHKYKFVITSEISSKDEADYISIPVFQYVLHGDLFIHCDSCFAVQSNKIKLKRCTRCFTVAYCSRDCQTKHWKTHSNVCHRELKMQVGVPFYVTFRKDSMSYDDLRKLLIERAKFSVELFSVPDEKPESSVGTSDCSYEMNKLSLSAYSTCVIKVASRPVNDESCEIITSDNFTTESINKSSYLIMEWQSTQEDSVSAQIVKSKLTPTHDLFKRDTDAGISEEGDQCSIYDCLRLFMEPESLDEKDSWKCPKCKTLQSAKKEMELSSPPRILLLHLKRFTYSDSGQKINKSVSYPLNGFDLSPFVAKETRSRMEHPLVYDLCGVITHSGSMRMGHYTCFTRMIGSEDQEEVGWRLFDDDSVRKIKSCKVNCSDAYVLVYRMQGIQRSLKISGLPENSGRRDVGGERSSKYNQTKTDSVEGVDVDIIGASGGLCSAQTVERELDNSEEEENPALIDDFVKLDIVPEEKSAVEKTLDTTVEDDLDSLDMKDVADITENDLD